MIFSRRQAGRQAKIIPSADKRTKIFSYHSQRQDEAKPIERSSGLGPKQKAQRTIKIFIFLPILGLFLYGLWLSSAPRVTLLEKTGTAYRTSAAYQSGIDEIWNKSLNNKTKITVNLAEIKAQMMNKFPELANVEIKIPLIGTQPGVVLEPAEPRLQIVNSSGSFFIKDSGIVMARNDQLSANNLKDLPTVEDKSDIDIEAGKYILTGSEVAFITTTHLGLVSNELQIESMTLPPIPFELDVRLKDINYYLKFNLQRDPLEGVGEYLVLKSRLEKNGIAPNKYVDLRVKEKVFYK